ncbi:diguanylate cyclase [Iodobacter sp. CM08]|uniref:sensor domain-containing diguanylate cyclase n=1 Tax=Iodobacter sp. CM08 TaxID=3085902 RepID=UPI002981AE4F|nr:diguanylate cyclase [Iodobacter sp. CM08]MDW5416121.1 diguanylate cyclase [Iodobacter sp. CM08]
MNIALLPKAKRAEPDPHAQIYTLGRQLLWGLLLLGLVPLLLTGGLAYQRSEQSLREKTGLYLAGQAESVIDKIDRNLFERYGDVQMIALNAAVRGSPETTAAAANAYVRAYGFYDLMIAVDMQGKIVAANTVSGDGRRIAREKLLGSSVAETPWFKQVSSGGLTAGQTYFADAAKDPLLEAALGQPEISLLFVSPIVNEQGKIVRVWANFASYERVVSAITHSAEDRLRQSGYKRIHLQVVDKQGRVLSDSHGEPFGSKALAKNSPAVQALIKGNNGVLTEVNRGKEELVGFAASKGALGFAGYGWGVAVRQDTEEAFATVRDLGRWILVSLLIAIPLVIWLALAISGRFRRITLQREQKLIRDADLQEFTSTVHRALELAETDSDAASIVSEAIELGLPQYATALMMSDSSTAHLAIMSQSQNYNASCGCGVKSPVQCLAFRRGQVQKFNDNSALDVCRYMRGRESGDCSAVCIPLTSIGQGVGILHLIGPAGQLPDEAEMQRASAIAAHAGMRLGVLRVMSESQLQARTDPLTGLLNRRSLENQAARALGLPEPACVAFADIDHFKRLNDSYGHDTGDRALRLFARVLKEALRPGDIVGRFGGEEFVVVFPNTDEAGALCGLERVRAALECRIAIAGLPVFTASFGLAAAFGPIEFNELVRTADMALLEAKRTGRNKVCIAGKPQMAEEPIVLAAESIKLEVSPLLKVDALCAREDVSLKS